MTNFMKNIDLFFGIKDLIKSFLEQHGNTPQPSGDFIRPYCTAYMIRYHEIHQFVVTVNFCVNVSKRLISSSIII